MIYLSNTQEAEFEELNPLLKAAFDQDTRLHTDAVAGGPPGYDNGQLLLTLIKDTRNQLWTVYLAEEVIGLVVTTPLDQSATELRLFALAPNYQGAGLGTKIWFMVAEKYPRTNWLVETPAYSTRNIYFYTEKCGFNIKGEKDYQGNRAIIFEKKDQI